jgi:hypothetical protein
MPAKNPPKRALTDAQRGVRLIDASTGVTECRTCGNRWAEIAGELVALPERLQRGAARLTGRARSGPPALLLSPHGADSGLAAREAGQ